jgi:hypothetical protein
MSWNRLLLYLDPFAPFKNIAAETDALDYNRRHRHLLLTYVRRWAVIGLSCAAGMEALGLLARVEPYLVVPIFGLELCFSASVCMLVLAAAVYWVLGLED